MGYASLTHPTCCRNTQPPLTRPQCRLNPNLNILPKPRQPARKPINRHTLHPAMKNLGKCRLIRPTRHSRSLLRQPTRHHDVLDRKNQRALRHQPFRFGSRKPDINKNIVAATLERNITHRHLPFSISRARFNRLSISNASPLGKPMPDFDFFIKTCRT